MKMLEFYQNCAIPNSACSLTTPIEISLTKKVLALTFERVVIVRLYAKFNAKLYF